MSAYRAFDASVPYRRPSWLHRLAHLLGLHPCICEVVYVEPSDRLVVYVVCATCGRREVLASRNRWARRYIDPLLEHGQIPRSAPFSGASVASTLASLDDMKARHAELTAACRRLDRVLGDRIAAGR